MKKLGLTFRDCYHHVKVLEELGLISGRFRYYATDKAKQLLLELENRSELRE